VFEPGLNIVSTERLLALYQDYYLNPTVEEWRTLFTGIVGYDFQNFDAFIEGLGQLSRPFSTDEVLLRSNKLSGYRFGPNWRIVIKEVERHLRIDHYTHFQGFVHSVFVRDDFRDNERSQYAFGMNNTMPNLLFSRGADDKHHLILRFLKNNYHTKVMLLGGPHILDQLLTSETFLDQCKEHVHGFVNCNDAAFIDTRLCLEKGFLFNDQMINWKSGLNFYTCRAGHQHFLPIFFREEGGLVNALNTAEKIVDGDDLFEISGERVLCDCKRPRLPFRFVPHIANFPNGWDYDRILRLKGELSGRYRWLQFVKRGGTTRIYHATSSGSMPEFDKTLLIEVFGDVKFEYPGASFQIFGKLPPFWMEV
jgi:hypothetical protein